MPKTVAPSGTRRSKKGKRRPLELGLGLKPFCLPFLRCEEEGVGDASGAGLEIIIYTYKVLVGRKRVLSFEAILDLDKKR